MTTRPLYLSRERFSEPVATHLEEGVRSGKLQREQVDRLATRYFEMHEGMPRDDMRQSLVSLMKNIKPQQSHFKTLQALRYGLTQFERSGQRFLPEEYEDLKMGFEHNGGLGAHMLADLGISPEQHAHTSYRLIMPNGSRELSRQEEKQMTSALGEGNTTLERLARHTGREPEELATSIHAALEDNGVTFRGTAGAFHGVDVIHKDGQVVLHVHSIINTKGLGKPKGAEHVIIPIGKQSRAFSRQVRDYLQEATGQKVPHLKTQ